MNRPFTGSLLPPQGHFLGSKGSLLREVTLPSGSLAPAFTNGATDPAKHERVTYSEGSSNQHLTLRGPQGQKGHFSRGSALYAHAHAYVKPLWGEATLPTLPGDNR